MLSYILKRIGLMIPTILGALTVTFLVMQFVPGGPIETIMAEQRAGGGAEGSTYKAGRDIDKKQREELMKQYGFDKPTHERYFKMLADYATFDLGKSFLQNKGVWELIKEKLPVSISLGLWTTLIVYLISIPLGVRKAIRDGSAFDVWTSGLVIAGNAIPGFLFGVMLIVLFAGGGFLKLFPLRGLVSEGFAAMTPLQQALDYLWHMVLPVTAMVIGGFAGLTILTKNSFLDEIGKQYVVTARAKGLAERRVLYGHVFRNAMLIVIAGFPAAFIGVFFTSSLLIEVIFSLDGLGQLGWEAAINRDYPVMFATLYVFTLMGLVMKIVGDLTYTLVDPRIDFAGRA